MEVRDLRSPTSVRFRLFGFVPLVIYLAHFRYNWSLGNPDHGLWMCHISNLSMGLGLLFAQPVLLRLGAVWIIPGIPLWIMEMTQTGHTPVITFVSHLGGVTVALIALRRVRADRFAWLYGMGCYLAIQHLCRLVTRPELNVNVAHTMYQGWDKAFGAYWQYWIFTTVSATFTLWIVNWTLFKLYPPVPEGNQGGIPADGEQEA